MGLVLRQVVVDNDRLRRVVEAVLDLFDLRDPGELRDIQRAVFEGEAVRPIKPGVDRLDFAFPALVDDGVDLVEEAAADEYRALVPLPQSARIADACRIDFDLEVLWFNLSNGNLSAAVGIGGGAIGASWAPIAASGRP